VECSPFLPQSVRRLRWLKCFSASTRQSAPVSCVEPEERKKTQNLTRNGRRTGSPPARAGFWKVDQGHRGFSDAPDKGHDRLAARCSVDSQLPLTLAVSSQSIATCNLLPPASHWQSLATTGTLTGVESVCCVREAQILFSRARREKKETTPLPKGGMWEDGTPSRQHTQGCHGKEGVRLPHLLSLFDISLRSLSPIPPPATLVAAPVTTAAGTQSPGRH
jgi:hypothetical protein